MSPEDWKHWEMYDKFIEAAERIISYTNTGHAPWEIIEGEDFNYRSLRVGEIFQQRLERHLMTQQIRQKYLAEMREEVSTNGAEGQPLPTDAPSTPITIMDGLDLSLSLEKKEYKEKLALLQGKAGRPPPEGRTAKNLNHAGF